MGAENLCHQAIFKNHASGAVAPLDAEVVQVGDAIWRRAQMVLLSAQAADAAPDRRQF